MIDLFCIWLPQIVGYAEAMQDGTLEKSWSEGDRSRTSVYCSDELISQVFGDLDADNMMAEARQSLGMHPKLVDSLSDFLCSLRRLDEWIEAHIDTGTWGQGEIIPPDVSTIFWSREWGNAQSAAASLVSAAGQVGISGNDFDPSQTLN